MDKLIKCGKFFSASNQTVKNNIAVIIRKNLIIDILPLDKISNEDNYEVIDLLDGVAASVPNAIFTPFFSDN
jgi:hypothetical protein